MKDRANPAAYFPRPPCGQAWPRDLVLIHRVAREVFWNHFPPTFQSSSAPGDSLLLLIPSHPYPSMLILSRMSARSPLRNIDFGSGYIHLFSEMFNSSPSDAGESLEAHSLAYKAFQDLVLMYLSYFLPGDLLSYHQAWPKGDTCIFL